MNNEGGIRSMEGSRSVEELGTVISKETGHGSLQYTNI